MYECDEGECQRDQAPEERHRQAEGREAACPFPKPTPVDAYCAALVDDHFYKK